MTGVPHAIASIMTRPKGSGQSIGKSSASFAQELRLLTLVDLADELDIGMGFDQRLDDSSQYARSALSIFAAS